MSNNKKRTAKSSLYKINQFDKRMEEFENNLKTSKTKASLSGTSFNNNNINVEK
jgi:hypothetical protein